MRRAAFACLAVLAACTTTVQGQGEPAPTPAILGFRKVIQTEPTDKGTKTPPASASSQGEIDKARAARQRVDVTAQAAVRSALDALDCSAPDPLRGNDDATMPLITCDPTLPAKYVLGPSFLTRGDVRDARAMQEPAGIGYAISIGFTEQGARIWGDFTTQNVGQQVAVVIDTAVVFAPTIQEAILGGDTVIHGGTDGFTRDEAEDLAARLRSR